MEVLTWPELVRRAGSDRAARAWIATGDWWRVLRNAYAPRSARNTTATRVAAARLVLPAGAAVSHRSALWLLGLDVLDDVLEVTTPRGRHLLPRPGLRPYIAQLPDDELCEHQGLLITSAARGVVDIARREPLAEAVAVGDAALRLGVTNAELIAAAVDRAAGLPGVAAARLVEVQLEPRSESLMESRLRIKLIRGGVPRPIAQFDVWSAGGHVARADLAIDGVLIEYDGRLQRLDRDHFTYDRRRHTRAVELGYEMRRYTAADYYRRSDRDVADEVLRAIRLAAGRDRSAAIPGPDTLPRPKHTPLPTRAERPERPAA